MCISSKSSIGTKGLPNAPLVLRKLIVLLERGRTIQFNSLQKLLLIVLLERGRTIQFNSLQKLLQTIQNTLPLVNVFILPS